MSLRVYNRNMFKNYHIFVVYENGVRVTVYIVEKSDRELSTVLNSFKSDKEVVEYSVYESNEVIDTLDQELIHVSEYDYSQ